MSTGAIDMVHAVFARHDADRDGGYAAVADLRAMLAGLGVAEREAVLECLLQVVLMKDQAWGGVALETLVQEGAVEVAHAIHSSLSSIVDENWKKELVRALMRLGYSAQKEELRQYVISRLPALVGGDLTLIAAFANIDPDASAELAARFWSEMHANGKEGGFLAYLPSLLINYSRIRPELVGDVIRLVQGLGALSGFERLAAAVRTYLEKPWAAKQLGPQAWECMRRDLLRMDISTN